MNIAVSGTGYVGLSLATLLSQKNAVIAVDIIQEKVKNLNEWESPIQEESIEKYFAEAREGEHLISMPFGTMESMVPTIHQMLCMQRQTL